jgi:DNA-binding response OmpR family regulator
MALLKEGEHLTPMEGQVLVLLMRERPRVMAAAEIYESVWGVDLSETSNALGVIVSQLRRKLLEPARLRTVRSVGYAFSPPR